jgi:hypothetical protein
LKKKLRKLKGIDPPAMPPLKPGRPRQKSWKICTLGEFIREKARLENLPEKKRCLENLLAKTAGR